MLQSRGHEELDLTYQLNNKKNKTQLLLNINSWYDQTDKDGFGGQKLNYRFLLKP